MSSAGIQRTLPIPARTVILVLTQALSTGIDILASSFDSSICGAATKNLERRSDLSFALSSAPFEIAGHRNLPTV